MTTFLSPPAFVTNFLPLLSHRSKTNFTSTFRPSTPLHTPAQNAHPRMLFNFPGFLSRREVSLPQNDKLNAMKRTLEVDLSRIRYRWTFDKVGNASFVHGLPSSELPNLGWIESIAYIIVRVAINASNSDTDEQFEENERNILADVTSKISPILYKIARGDFDESSALEAGELLDGFISNHPRGKGRTLDQYKGLYQNIKLDPIAKKDIFLQDNIFGWYRVAGPNPMRITKLQQPATKMFPQLTDQIFQGIQGFKGDTLQAAMAENRLFYVDYPEFDGIETGRDTAGNVKDSFLYAPRCLLAIPLNPSYDTSVLPIAIACGQNESYPMYTANSAHTDKVTWLAAKMAVQVADAVIHEVVYHLGRTHLMLEVFVCSLYRTLPERHPIHRLLKSHFYGTVFINLAATITLVSDGGKIDRMTAPDIGQTRQMSASSLNDPSCLFDDLMPDVEMAKRGVLDVPGLCYPYRDDAMLLWSAINKWVRAYLSSYYTCDKDVAEDYELENWVEEVTASESGNLHGFGKDGKIETLDYLVRAISMIIFTASVQHAAVNFPQSTMMQYAPAMPLAGYTEAPKTKTPFASIDEWVTKMVPDLERSAMQLTTAELIGVLKYTKLGEYGKDFDFVTDEVDMALKVFQDELGGIGAKIQGRNMLERKAGLPVYNHLVPQNIPQSINI